MISARYPASCRIRGHIIMIVKQMTTHSDIGLLSFLVRINMYCLRIAEPPIYFYTFPTCKNPKLFFYFLQIKACIGISVMKLWYRFAIMNGRLLSFYAYADTKYLKKPALIKYVHHSKKTSKFSAKYWTSSEVLILVCGFDSIILKSITPAMLHSNHIVLKAYQANWIPSFIIQ